MMPTTSILIPWELPPPTPLQIRDHISIKELFFPFRKGVSCVWFYVGGDLKVLFRETPKYRDFWMYMNLFFLPFSFAFILVWGWGCYIWIKILFFVSLASTTPTEYDAHLLHLNPMGAPPPRPLQIFDHTSIKELFYNFHSSFWERGIYVCVTVLRWVEGSKSFFNDTLYPEIFECIWQKKIPFSFAFVLVWGWGCYIRKKDVFLFQSCKAST